MNKAACDTRFLDPAVTATGEPRARVALRRPRTLWFNTGTLCNIECANCYIESSPSNDALAYLTLGDVENTLDQLEERRWPVREIGFTGGEPFMNPAMIDLARAALSRSYRVLILTNAMAPMMRPGVREGLLELNEAFPGAMALRVSMDHHQASRHDSERGAGSYAKTLEGMRWLRDKGMRMSVAGRAAMEESDIIARDGYSALFGEEEFAIDARNPAETVLFPEMDAAADVPEITTKCWDILGKSPDDVMCSHSRMVLRRRGAAQLSVVACTLLPYDPRFELGSTLREAEQDVSLNHPHCARFCVLGGASCSA